MNGRRARIGGTEKLNGAESPLLRHWLREGGEQYGARFAEQYSVINLARTKRVVLLVTPSSRGALTKQVAEVLRILRNLLGSATGRTLPTVQTIFLRDPADLPLVREMFHAHFEQDMPVTSFVVQPPCSGAGLAVELWGICGPSVRIERPASDVAIVHHDGLKWVHVTAWAEEIQADAVRQSSNPTLNQSSTEAGVRNGTFGKARGVFEEIDRLLLDAGAEYRRVVRAWFYIGGINERENCPKELSGNPCLNTRYAEFNRARNDFYLEQNLNAESGVCALSDGYAGYPASTGIGTSSEDLGVSCLAVESQRPDVRLVTLENPGQTPAYAYDAQHAPYAPRFSRAMALIAGNVITTWISGTASIRESETVFPGDIERQTQQTFDNIERLIANENFTRHGAREAGARLQDLAKVRVYLKRLEDYAACKRVCEKRIPGVPAVYVLAQVCRPELLVEIEGVAFSHAHGN